MSPPLAILIITCAAMLVAGCAASHPAPISSRSEQITPRSAAPAQQPPAQPPVTSPVPPVTTAPQAAQKPLPQPPAATGAEPPIVWAWPVRKPHPTLFSEATKGVDLPGRRGDSVMAAADGTVSYVGSSLKGYGEMVVVKHSPSYLSVYADNSRILVKEGQTVIRGQKIAELGDDTGNRLHFEIRHMGKPVDPLAVMPSLHP